MKNNSLRHRKPSQRSSHNHNNNTSLKNTENNNRNQNNNSNSNSNLKETEPHYLSESPKLNTNNRLESSDNNINNTNNRSNDMHKRDAIHYERESDSLPLLNNDVSHNNRNKDNNLDPHENNESDQESYFSKSNNDLNEKEEKRNLESNNNSKLTQNQSQGIKKDLPGMLLLVLLYVIQGIPTGLTFGSIPFLLQEHSSYTQIGIFSFAQYPYSLKLLWSPIVDAIYLKKFGRRKTWIVPIQITAGIILLYLSRNIDSLLFEQPIHVYSLTGIFFVLTLLMATQDIAVDGWAITILSKENLGYASTCQNVGLSCGFFLSFTILLAFSSVGFSQRVCQTLSLTCDAPLMTLASYLWFWGIVYLAVTAFLVIVVREQPADDGDTPDATPDQPHRIYSQMFKILKLPQMKSLLFVLLFCRIGFSVADNATQLKLRERGLTRETLAMVVTVAFPFEFIFAVLAGKWSRGRNPLRPWYFGFKFRLVMAAIIPLAVYLFHADNLSNPFFKVLLYGLVLCLTLMYSLASNFMFVSMGAFYALISDSAIGGTYMTLLNTFGNFGGTWPRFFVMLAIDKFDNKICRPCEQDECLDGESSQVCDRVGVDGYYIVAALCVAIGIGLMQLMRKQIDILQATKTDQWKVTSQNNHKK